MAKSQSEAPNTFQEIYTEFESVDCAEPPKEKKNRNAKVANSPMPRIRNKKTVKQPSSEKKLNNRQIDDIGGVSYDDLLDFLPHRKDSSDPSLDDTEFIGKFKSKSFSEDAVFKSGDKICKPFNIRNKNKNGQAPQMPNDVEQMTSFHRNLANNLRGMNEDELTELFQYVDKCGGREFVNGFFALLEDREVALKKKKPPKEYLSDSDDSLRDLLGDDGIETDFRPETQRQRFYEDLRPESEGNDPFKYGEPAAIQFSFHQPVGLDGRKQKPKILPPRSSF